MFMFQNLEIEFKSLLTKAQYYYYLERFFQNTTAITQTNEYLSDLKGQLRAKGYSLRIRHLDNAIEFTLKKPQAFAKMEYNEYLTKDQYQALIQNTLKHSTIIDLLLEDGIDATTLIIVGRLKTTRYQIPYLGGNLCLDYSEYKNTCDYEIEYEAANEKEGRTIFKEILSLQAIEYTKNCPGKIARALG